ncbi:MULTISPECIES: transglycosylase family protein [unclassified Janibacter]|uniref:transglycosylase family protein n=1 Tax=unclassified Janibacter TaxID=2649294 RepID=UPI003D031BDF
MFTTNDFPDLAPAAPRRTRRRLAGTVVAAATLVAGGISAASVAGAAETVWDRVATCESGGNWHINTGNGYYGGLQFSYQTWKGFGGQTYAVTADRASKAQQIAIAQKVLKVQGPGAWPVCSVRAGLTVTNGLAVNPWGDRDDDTTSRDDVRGALTVDGVRGPMTNRAIETWVGGSVDGSLSSNDVRLLQRKVGALADGVIGPVTTRALQGRVGAVIDGIWGAETTSKLQAYLNRVLG